MQDQDPVHKQLLSAVMAAETRVWQALVTGDAGADEAALAETFLGVYPSGFAGRADHVGQLANGPTVARFELSDARVKPLGDAHALLSYCADFQRVGRPSSERMYVSSIWQRQVGDWINIFSQDTPADPH
jgi:hypothetical protein